MGPSGRKRRRGFSVGTRAAGKRLRSGAHALRSHTSHMTALGALDSISGTVLGFVVTDREMEESMGKPRRCRDCKRVVSEALWHGFCKNCKPVLSQAEIGANAEQAEIDLRW